MPDAQAQTDSAQQQRTRFMWIYAIAAAGALAQYAVSLQMALIGCLILWVCDRMLKKHGSVAQGSIYQSHATWINRTLHIGGYYLLPVAVLIMFFFIFKETHVLALIQDIIKNQITTVSGMETLLRGYLVQYGDTINRITYICITPPIIWWVWRCWTGFRRAARAEPIPSPQSLI